MKPFDPSQPLISLHIPKTAGTSYREALKSVFGHCLLSHYNAPHTINGVLVAQRPGKFVWDELLKAAAVAPICIHGHFRNSDRAGVDHYYPEATQFATLLREPLDAMVSNYFYMQNVVSRGKPRPDFRWTALNDYIEENNSRFFGNLPALAKKSPQEFVNDHLVLAGCLEQMDVFATRFKAVFGQDLEMPRLNAAARTEQIDPAVAQRWRDRNQDVIAFYDLVRAA